jgi:hypothetical protein
MKKLFLAMLSAAGTISAAHAAEVDLKLPVDVHGGFSAGYSYADSTAEGFEVTNFLVELSKEAKTGDIGFTAAFGYLATNPATYGDKDFGLQYGYLTLIPLSGLTLDAGVLPTMVGYEVANTYANPNITIGKIWSGQPVYYRGARATYTLNENVSVFGEVNDDGKDGAWSLGSTGSVRTIDYVVSYYDKNNPSEPDIVDLVLSSTINENLDLAFDGDYQIGKNKDGYGVEFYVIPKMGNISLPVRFEYFDDNGSGAYGGNKGWDLAITPTYHYKSGYIRGEVYYYNYDKPESIVGSPDAASKYTDKSNTVYRVELGYVF